MANAQLIDIRPLLEENEFDNLYNALREIIVRLNVFFRRKKPELTADPLKSEKVESCQTEIILNYDPIISQPGEKLRSNNYRRVKIQRGWKEREKAFAVQHFIYGACQAYSLLNGLSIQCMYGTGLGESRISFALESGENFECLLWVYDKKNIRKKTIVEKVLKRSKTPWKKQLPFRPLTSRRTTGISTNFTDTSAKRLIG